jgi:hypothetical protein
MPALALGNPLAPNALALTRLSSIKRTVRAGQHTFA